MIFGVLIFFAVCAVAAFVVPGSWQFPVCFAFAVFLWLLDVLTGRDNGKGEYHRH